MGNFMEYYNLCSKEYQKNIRMEIGINEKEFNELFNDKEYLGMIINYVKNIEKYYGFGLENLL